MNEEQHIEMRLWDYIDGDIDGGEKKQIETLLANNRKWQEIYSELLQLHQLMKTGIELEEPSMRFTKNVMEEIATIKVARATKSYINRKVIFGIAMFFLIVIGGFLLYGFSQVDWAKPGTDTWSFNLPTFDVSKYLNKEVLNIFLMVNIVLALILFDRFYLKNRYRSKQKHA